MAEQNAKTASVEEPQGNVSDGSEIVLPSEKVTSSSLLIEVATGDYPISLYALAVKYEDRSFSVTPPRADIEALGYAVVEPTPFPEGDVVTEGAPELVDGVWRQVWDVREWNTEETAVMLTRKKNELNSRVMSVRNDDFEIGMPFTVDGGEEFHVQLRVEDKINLILLQLEAKTLVGGDSGNSQSFRSLENRTIVMTPEKMIEMTNAALLAVKAIYQGSWDLKDQIDQAESLSELPTVPVTFIPSH